MVGSRHLHIIFSIIMAFGICRNIKAQVAIDTAKDFTVKDLNSISHHLFDYLDDDKIVVIDFFTTNCGPCQTYASHVSQAFEYFGCNTGNVIFLGMNWGSNNEEVREFDSIWGAHYPSVSGLQGGGNNVVDSFQVLSYPTVAIVTPDHQISVDYIWPPTYDSIQYHVLALGGVPSICTVSAIDLKPVGIFNVRVLSSREVIVEIIGISSHELSFRIYSFTGQILTHSLLKSGINYLKLPTLKTGLFFCTLMLDNSLIGQTKFFIP